MGVKDFFNELIVDPLIDTLGKAGGMSEDQIAKDRATRHQENAANAQVAAERKVRRAEAYALQADYDYVRSVTKGMTVEQRRKWKQQNGYEHVPDCPEVGQ